MRLKSILEISWVAVGIMALGLLGIVIVKAYMGAPSPIRSDPWFVITILVIGLMLVWALSLMLLRTWHFLKEAILRGENRYNPLHAIHSILQSINIYLYPAHPNPQTTPQANWSGSSIELAAVSIGALVATAVIGLLFLPLLNRGQIVAESAPPSYPTPTAPLVVSAAPTQEAVAPTAEAGGVSPMGRIKDEFWVCSELDAGQVAMKLRFSILGEYSEINKVEIILNQAYPILERSFVVHQPGLYRYSFEGTITQSVDGAISENPVVGDGDIEVVDGKVFQLKVTGTQDPAVANLIKAETLYGCK